MAAMVRRGMATDLRPSERPPMVRVATPISAWRASSWIGLAGGEVLGDEADDDAAGGTAEDAEGDAVAETEGGADNEGRDDVDGGGSHGADAEGAGGVLAGHDAHEQDAEDGAEQADGGEDERQLHEEGDVARCPIMSRKAWAASLSVGAEAGTDGGRDGDGGDLGAAVGFEDVGSHAGDVPDVVPDIVGDHAGVAGVVLGNAGLDLADEVGPDVGGLGEDAAADPVEERDERGAHREALHDLGDVFVGRRSTRRARRGR